jgi:hypothetical protein
MNKLFLACVAVSFAGISATALAASKADPPTPHPDKGNQGCYLIIPKLMNANPGRMFQWIKDISGANPPAWVDFLEATFPGEVSIDNVGDFIDQRCEDPGLG